jgi:hypothetical protein
MRLTILMFVALLLVPACGLSVRSGHHRSSHHSSHGSHHRTHRHWNAAGPAYAEASVLTQITIIQATLPNVIEGEFSATEEAAWRKDWPILAAQLVADGLTTRTDGVVTGSVASTQPRTGYYMTLEITQIDVGDVRPSTDDKPDLRGSSLAAHGFIYNASTGQLVADVKFREGSGWTGNNQFEVFMARAGSSLGDWFKARRADK